MDPEGQTRVYAMLVILLALFVFAASKVFSSFSRVCTHRLQTQKAVMSTFSNTLILELAHVPSTEGGDANQQGTLN